MKPRPLSSPLPLRLPLHSRRESLAGAAVAENSAVRRVRRARSPVASRSCSTLSVLVAAALAAGCASTGPTQPAGTSASAASGAPAAETGPTVPTEWRPPILFSTRLVTTTPEAAPLKALQLGPAKSFSFVSDETPQVAAALARQMRAGGLNVVPAGTAGATEIRVELQAWLMPPGMYGRTRADVDVRQPIESILAAGSTAQAAAPATGSASSTTAYVPLGGWTAPIGQTGMSVGAAGFLLENLATATGARQRINAFFGADATGTVCLGTERTCIRRKGPQQDFVLTGSFSVDGTVRSVSARLLMIQHEPNILQPLAYAIADWRDAALGRRVADCDYYKSGQRAPSCEPVLDMVPLQELL